MAEHLAPVLYYLEVHLLFASLVACVAWILTSLHCATPTTKYWIWIAATLNFFVPLGATIDRLWAAHLVWARPLGVLGDAGANLAGNTAVLGAATLVWVAGCALMLMRLGLRIRSDRVLLAAQGDETGGYESPSLQSRVRKLGVSVPVKFVNAAASPAVQGLLQPCICLPQGIERILSEHELAAVLMHECTHARRRDNLIRLAYEIGLCLFWFHPLLWVAGGRLELYRELSCDEPVIRSSRAVELVTALAKLAAPQDPPLLCAPIASCIAQRIARLTAAQATEASRSSWLLASLFGLALLAGIAETVAHTACCFVSRI